MQSTKNILENYKSYKALEAKSLEAISSKAIKAIEGYNHRQLKLKAVEAKALQIMEQVKADDKWLRFYCKAVHQLSEYQLNNILGNAVKANSPCRYFATAVKGELILKEND